MTSYLQHTGCAVHSIRRGPQVPVEGVSEEVHNFQPVVRGGHSLLQSWRENKTRGRVKRISNGTAGRALIEIDLAPKELISPQYERRERRNLKLAKKNMKHVVGCSLGCVWVGGSFLVFFGTRRANTSTSSIECSCFSQFLPLVQGLDVHAYP